MISYCLVDKWNTQKIFQQALKESSGDFVNNQFYSFDAPTDFNLNQEDEVNFPISTLGDYGISGTSIPHKSGTYGIYENSNIPVASNSNHWNGCDLQYNYNSTPGNYNYTPDSYSGISGNFTNPGSYTNIPGNFTIPGSYNCIPGNYNTFGNSKMPGILNYTSDYRNKENYNTTSSTSSIQTPKKCIILKPVAQNSKSNLKYTIIRSFTPSRRAHSSAPLRATNSETETIAQKIPISLPKIILDVAKPKVDNFDQNVVSDRSTIYRVRELPQHVQNVIGGLTKTVKSPPASRPLVVDASQFQNRIGTNFTTTNYQMGFNNTQPAQNATSSWNVDNNWRNNYFGQTHMSGYLNNMSNNGYAVSSQMSQNMPIFPTTSTPSSSFTSDLLNKNTQNIVEMTKSTNLTSDDLKIDDILNELTSNNTGDSEELPKTTNFTTNVDWNTLGTTSNPGIVDPAVKFSTPTQAVNTPRISTPKKLDKVVPTIITGTRIIPNVPSPSKNRLNNVFGNNNTGQSTINGPIFRTKHLGRNYDSEKNFTGKSFAACNNNTGSMSEPKIINNNMSTSRLNSTYIGRTDVDCKSNVSIPPVAKNDTSRIENKPNFVNDQSNSTNLKTDLGDRMNNSIQFDNTNLFNKSTTIIPDNSTMSSTNIFRNIDAKTNLTSSGTNVEFKGKASSIIADDDFNFLTGNTNINNSCNSYTRNHVMNSHSSTYPNVFGSLEAKNIFPTNTSSSFKKGGIFDELSTITDDPYFQTVENTDKYNIVRASSLLDECEKILPINSEEEELLNTPDCAFDNSFNVDMPTNVSNTVSDVFGVHKNTSNNDNYMNKNTMNISQAIPIEKNTSQDNSLDFSVTLDLPVILESEFMVKEEDKTDEKEVKNVDNNNCKVGTLKDVEDLSLLPNYQEVSKDFSFGSMKEEQCDGKIDEFDIDSLIEEKNKEFEMGEGKKDEDVKRNGEEERTDSNDESCTSITIKEEEKNDDEGDSLKIEEKSLDSIDDVGGDKFNLSEVMSDDFKQHFKSHCKKNNYACEVCNKSFKHETTLKTHFTRCHTNENRKYKCNVCEQSFGVWRMLRDHRETVHPSLDKHCCYICEKLFPNKTALKAHVQRHTDPRRYKCQYCDKVYKDRAGLNVHLVVHTQVSKFSCSLCDRKFGKKNLLTDHMKIFHLKQKDHTCHECNRSFSTKNTLKRHSWIHTGEKNYICEICGRPFRQKVALTVHMKVHNKPQRAPHHAFQCNSGVGMNLCGDGGGNLPGYKHRYEDNTNNIDSKLNDFVIL